MWLCASLRPWACVLSHQQPPAFPLQAAGGWKGRGWAATEMPLCGSSLWALVSSPALELVVVTRLRPGLVSSLHWVLSVPLGRSLFESWFSHLPEVLFAP